MVSVYYEKRLGYRVTEEEVALRKKMYLQYIQDMQHERDC